MWLGMLLKDILDPIKTVASLQITGVTANYRARKLLGNLTAPMKASPALPPACAA